MRLLLAGSMVLVGGCSLFEDATSVPVDYDVELIEPVEFDGSDALGPASLDVAVSTANPTAMMTIPNATTWGPLLHANAIVEGSGDDRIFSIRSASAPTFTGTAPVSFSIDVFSVDGVVFGETLSPEPEDVASCTFVLDPATAAADDFGIALEDCLVDWASTNGIPAELGFSVTSASTAAAAGGAPDYEFSSLNTMSTNQAFESDCELEVALPDNVTDRIDNISFEDIQLDAVGTADAPVVVAWFGEIYDGDGELKASAFGVDALSGGDSREYHAVVTDGDLTVSGDADVTTDPGAADQFLDATIRALAGLDVGTPGSGMACWFSYGDTPRAGSLAVLINGTARAGAI